MVFVDCGGKLHFATSKSFEGKQDHYVCNNYKSNRSTCTALYIREDVLREIVLERIRAVKEYIRNDVDGFQEEWLQCRRTDQERSIRDDKKKLEQAKKRLADLERVKLEIEVIEEWVEQREEMNDGLDAFILRSIYSVYITFSIIYNINTYFLNSSSTMNFICVRSVQILFVKIVQSRSVSL